MSDKNKEIWAAVDRCFEHADSSKEEGLRMFQQAIRQYGGAVILASVAWVAERLEKEGVASAQMALMGAPNSMLNLRLFVIAESTIGLLGDVVALENEPGKSLIASILVTLDEDEQALMAYLLATRFVTSLETWSLQYPAAKILLKNLLQETEGTSCRMALSYALYAMGEKAPWEKLVYGNVFLKQEFVRTVEKLFIEMFPKREKEAKSLVCREIAVPGSTDFQIPVPDQWGIREFLALDIASNGQQFLGYPNWKRKSK